jgi:hypothetical protein
MFIRLFGYLVIWLSKNELPNQQINFFAPDCSGKLRGIEKYFLLSWQSDQRELLLGFIKKVFNLRTCSVKLE